MSNAPCVLKVYENCKLEAAGVGGAARESPGPWASSCL